MSLAAGCPRCPTPPARTGDGVPGWSCPEHGVITPLWRPEEASYDGFVDHLTLAGGFPTYLPWPLGPGWRVTDFGVVEGSASFTSVSGTSDLDGPVDVLIVAEEAGIGLGARCAGTRHDDPGPEIGDGPPATKVRVEQKSVPLWPVSTSGTAGEWDRSVVAGEAGGRWLWLVLRPASAMLLLREEWILRNVATMGPALLDVPFGGPKPPW